MATAAQPTIYLIPGLGADGRMFRDLELPGCKVQVLERIEAGANESFDAYIDRLVAPVNWDERPVIAGVSFGGMATVNICHRYPARAGVIISSIKTRSELPWLLKLVCTWQLHKLLPVSAAKNRTGLVHWYFGITTTISKELMTEILKGSDPAFMRWALTQIGLWKNEVVPPQLSHIHGTVDRVFPFRRINNCIAIDKGHHFMVVDRASEVSGHLLSIAKAAYI